MSETLSVAHVVVSLDVGGLERIVLDLVREGRRLGQRVAVICLERPGTLAPVAEAMGARVLCTDKRPGIRLGQVRKLRALLRELRADVVHTHQVAALFYAGPAARGAGAAVVHTEHGKHYAARLRTRLLGRLAALFADRFICVSRDIAAEVRTCRVAPPRKVAVIANGIDARRFAGRGGREAVRGSLGIPAGAPVFGTVGRLTEVKRQDLLLRAFARAGGRLPEAHLLLVGDGPLRAELGGLADHLGVAGRVHFAGYQPRPERYLQAMDVFALTSRSEGMPLSVLEAWAAGLPVVASRVGGLAEMIDDGRTGVLFPSGDEAALAAALLGLGTDPAHARRLGDAGRERVEAAFHLRRTAANYHRQYVQLCAPAGRGRPARRPAACPA